MTVHFEYFSGASVTATGDLESDTKLIFNQSDNVTFNSPTIIPNVGTKYSWFKYVGFYVITPEGGTATNLRLALSGAMPTGLAIFAVPIAVSDYVQAGVINVPDNASVDVTSAGPNPTILGVASTKLSTTPFVFDVSGGSLNVTNQLVGKLCVLVLAVGASYVASDGYQSLPDVIGTYS